MAVRFDLILRVAWWFPRWAVGYLCVCNAGGGFWLKHSSFGPYDSRGINANLLPGTRLPYLTTYVTCTMLLALVTPYPVVLLSRCWCLRKLGTGKAGDSLLISSYGSQPEAILTRLGIHYHLLASSAAMPVEEWKRPAFSRPASGQGWPASRVRVPVHGLGMAFICPTWRANHLGGLAAVDRWAQQMATTATAPRDPASCP